MLEPYEQKSRVRLVTTVVAILVVAGAVLLADHLKSQGAGSGSVAQTATTTTDTTSTDSTAANSATSGSGVAKDGTYNDSESYSVPHGSEQIEVSVTVKDGVVTDASVKNSANDFDSAQYQEEFTAGYKTKVVGKKISGLQISVIAGASDTTQGFNDALSRIAAKAEA